MARGRLTARVSAAFEGWDTQLRCKLPPTGDLAKNKKKKKHLLGLNNGLLPGGQSLERRLQDQAFYCCVSVLRRSRTNRIYRGTPEGVC